MSRQCFLLLTVLALSGCGSCNAPAPPTPVDAVASPPQLVTPAPTALRRGTAVLGPQRIQLLIDDSASMADTSQAIVAVTGLVSRAASLAAGVDFQVGGTQTCRFSTKRTDDCVQGFIARPGDFAGYTTLHDAVAAFSDYDLSMVLTDGVPAQSKPGLGPCATGVDTGCVAQSLRQSLAPRPGTAQDVHGGLWLVPVMTMHKGRFLTERPGPGVSIDPAAIEQVVGRDTSTSATATNPAIAGDGTLTFNYHGPRSLYLLVHAANREVGQSLVARLYEQVSAEPLAMLQAPKEYLSGTALLPPIEVYPAAPLPALSSACSLEPTDSQGVFGPCVLAGQQASATCSIGRANQGALSLSPIQSSSTAVHSLIPLKVAVTTPAGIGSLTGSPWERQVKASLTCGGEAGIAACAPSPGKIEWTAEPDYSSFDSKAENQKYLLQLSTDDLSREPHKLLALGALLTNFYQRLSVEPLGAKRPLTSSLTVCRQ